MQLQRTKGKSSNRQNIATLKKEQKYHRSAIDLPTTEPCLEFYASDCDEYIENRLCITKTSSFRAQSKFDQRPRTCEKTIPDELIITSAKQKNDSNTDSDNNITNIESKERINNAIVSELPAIRGSKRLNNAWHNMKK